MTAVFPPTPSFRYLSSGGEWPELARFGLVTRDGALELPALPGPDPASAAASGTAALQGPARIAVTAGGTVYVVDPEASRIRRIGCDGLEQCFDCRDADEESLLSGPRGVLIGPRGRLFVADTGHHRVVILDPATAALAGVWGQASPWSEPTPSPDDGRFQSPWDLAADFRGRVYVADAGAQDAAGKWSGGRVQRFDVDGVVQPSFWQTMRAQSTVPSVPTSIAVVLLDADDPSSERLLVLDAEPARLLVYTLDGVIDDDATDVWSNVARAIGAGGAPIDLAWGPEALYVADGVSGRVFVFGRDGAYLGTARTPSFAAGIALDPEGRLLLRPNAAAAIERLLAHVAFADSGGFIAGPFEAPRDAAAWHRVVSEVTGIDENTHFRIYTLTSNRKDAVAIDSGTVDALLGLSPDLARDPLRTRVDRWRPTPWDARDALVLNTPARYLWIGGTFHGDGSASPSLRQLRLEHGHAGLRERLPAIYRREDPARDPLRRFIAFADAAFQHEDRFVDRLPSLFDPYASPVGAPGESWLDWLASWLDFAIDESWSETDRRTWLDGAFALFARRGTPEGVRALLRMYAGVDARIEEPVRTRTVWSLADGAALGEHSTLAAFEPQGAVLETTAVVDRSHLIHDADFGAPVFDDLAHHFVVTLYGASDARVAAARATLDREKPAHTTYELCVLGAELRVGVQARVGIDAIVGRAPSTMPLDGAHALGFETATPAHRDAAVVGDTARVGHPIT